MARESVEQLRAAIVADTEELRRLKSRREELRRMASDVGKEERKVVARRARRIKRARDNGASVADLAGDSGLTQARVRQLAPKPKRPPKTGPGAAAVDEQLAAAATAEQLADAPPGIVPATPRGSGAFGFARELADDAGPFARTPENTVRVEQLARDNFPTPELQRAHIAGITAAVREVIGQTTSANLPPEPEAEQDDDGQDDDEPAAAPAPKLTVRLNPTAGVAGILKHTAEVLRQCRGDVDMALKYLKDLAVEDAMALLDASRAGATYDFTAHPSIPAPLKRPGRKQADMVWEGRPRFTNPSTPQGAEVEVLDMNGAYLSALRRTHLPIGRLVEDPPGTPFNPRRSGIYLVEPIRWAHDWMPNPLGDGREQTGPVWITGATMRLLLRAEKLGFGTAPAILESHTSGSSENLLTKFGTLLATARSCALDAGDKVAEEYVKALYSRFVSTAGDSAYNRDLFRPEWVHEIRSQAFANLWYKAEKVARAGIGIHRMMGTDELHVASGWRNVRVGDLPLFTLGRHLSQVKTKGTYRVGVDRA